VSDLDVSTGEPVPPADRGRPNRRRSAIETIVLALFALLVVFLVRLFVAQAFFIPSGSMENTLLPGDRILVSKLSTSIGSVQRGQVVVFKDPGGWLPPAPHQTDPLWTRALRDIGLVPAVTEGDLVKRVIGVGGDHVACCDVQGRVTVNGQPLNEPYLYPGNKPIDCPDATGKCRFDVTVPDGDLWVMGDHRSVSRDSRLQPPGHGFVPESDVVGRAVAIFWPLNRATWISVPPTFADVPATQPRRSSRAP
jgi:signal peptidase I